MNRNRGNKINPSFFVYAAAGLLLLFFWEIILTVAVMGGVLYLLWHCRHYIFLLFRRLYRSLNKFIRERLLFGYD